MDAATLQDRIYRAGGRSAAITGTACDLFRPNGLFDPLASRNRLLRLPATFLPMGGRLRKPVIEPMWEGIFDAAYTQPGDILRRLSDGQIYYVAAQQPLLPVLCIRAPRLIDLSRPASPANAGLNLYGGVVASTDTSLAEAWPASILMAGAQGTGLANIEAELTPGNWQVLLPPSLKIALYTSDIISDDQGRTGIIAAIETTDLGTRLTARQAST